MQLLRKVALKVVLLNLFISISIFNGTGFAQGHKLQIPVPINEDILGIRIPYYNEKGQLEIQFDAHIARKTDENHVTLRDLKISLFEENRDTTFIEMPDGIFDLQTNILYGDDGAHIKRQDMNIIAESIVFNAKDYSAHCRGKVKMTIFDLDLHNSQDSKK